MQTLSSTEVNLGEQNSTLSSNEVTSRNKTIHIPPPIPFNQGWAVFFFLEQWHNIIVYRGWGKVLFYLF